MHELPKASSPDELMQKEFERSQAIEAAAGCFIELRKLNQVLAKRLRLSARPESSVTFQLPDPPTWGPKTLLAAAADPSEKTSRPIEVTALQGEAAISHAISVLTKIDGNKGQDPVVTFRAPGIIVVDDPEIGLLLEDINDCKRRLAYQCAQFDRGGRGSRSALDGTVLMTAHLNQATRQVLHFGFEGAISSAPAEGRWALKAAGFGTEGALPAPATKISFGWTGNSKRVRRRTVESLRGKMGGAITAIERRLGHGLPDNESLALVSIERPMPYANVWSGESYLGRKVAVLPFILYGMSPESVRMLSSFDPKSARGRERREDSCLMEKPLLKKPLIYRYQPEWRLISKSKLRDAGVDIGASGSGAARIR